MMLNSPSPGNGKIKVCHIITKMVYGGASIATLQLIRHLDHDKYDITIICGRESKNEGSLIDEALNDRNLNVIVMPEIVREVEPVNDLIALFKIIALIRKHRYDVVHTASSKCGILGRLAAAINRVPIIIHSVHGWGLKAQSPVVRPFFRLIEQITAFYTDYFLFVTESDMNEARLYRIGNPARHHHIGFGINLRPFLNFDRDASKKVRKSLGIGEGPVVGTVGRVSPAKNPAGFIEIAKRVIQKKKDTTFVFAGGGELLEEMRSIVDREKLSKKILFLGLRKDVPEVEANYDVFILPSLWEGLPLALIEAMAMGKPVVVNQLKGLKELVKNDINGVMVSAEGVGNFADKIVTLLDNTELQQALSEKARQTALKYDFQYVAKKVQGFYQGVISDKP